MNGSVATQNKGTAKYNLKCELTKIKQSGSIWGIFQYCEMPDKNSGDISRRI
jgi:hypothetical protein